jgi:hypothetical protein
MGEATYYMKARFESAEAAQQALPRIKEFLEQMAKAESDWEKSFAPDNRTVGERFEELRTKYSSVFELLKLDKVFERKGKSDTSMNFLAGQLSSPVRDPQWKIWRDGDDIVFHGTVWHYADWEPMARAIEQLGADYAFYISDEYENPLDFI